MEVFIMAREGKSETEKTCGSIGGFLNQRHVMYAEAIQKLKSALECYTLLRVELKIELRIQD